MNKAELDKILDNHKLWLKTNGEEGEKANLSGANLSGANLSDANLSGANLSGANLSGANLSGAELSGANLSDANLSGAELSDANLSGANLSGAELSDANLSGAELRRANLDFSAFPLWCGGLDVHIDDKQAIQLLYHLVRNVQYSKNTSQELKKLCKLKSIIKKANEFHKVDECGMIETGGRKLNLYQIDNEIMNCVDSETGEIIDVERLEELQLERAVKIESIALWIKNLVSDAAALKAEEATLADRRKKAESKAEQLRAYLDSVLSGSKFETAKVMAFYRKSKAVEVDDAFIDWAQENNHDVYLTYKPPVANKTEIKSAIADGIDFEGHAQIVERQTLNIK